MLSNYNTHIKARVDSTKEISLEERDFLISLVNERMEQGFERYCWNAEIHGITVQLITNSFHLHDFWVENWFPGRSRGVVMPHGRIYAVTGVGGHEPHAYYHHESRTAIFINTEYYGQCKSWALGVAADILEMQHDVHSIHGACAVANGKGIVIIAPTGTGKSTHTWGIVQRPDGRIHSDDWIFVHYRNGEAIADISERRFYLRTDMVGNFPELAATLDRCKCENVEKDDFTAFANSRAILDPEWIGGPGKFKERVQVELVILLRRDSTSPAEVKLGPEEAIEILEEGQTQILAGAGGDIGMIKYEPYYNPYLLVSRRDFQRRFYELLFNIADCYILNTGVETVSESFERISRIIDEV